MRDFRHISYNNKYKRKHVTRLHPLNYHKRSYHYHQPNTLEYLLSNVVKPRLFGMHELLHDALLAQLRLAVVELIIDMRCSTSGAHLRRAAITSHIGKVRRII